MHLVTESRLRLLLIGQLRADRAFRVIENQLRGDQRTLLIGQFWTLAEAFENRLDTEHVDLVVVWQSYSDEFEVSNVHQLI